MFKNFFFHTSLFQIDMAESFLAPTFAMYMSEPAKKKIFNLSLFKRVFQFVKPYEKWFYMSLLLAITLATECQEFFSVLTDEGVFTPMSVFIGGTEYTAAKLERWALVATETDVIASPPL